MVLRSSKYDFAPSTMELASVMPSPPQLLRRRAASRARSGCGVWVAQASWREKSRLICLASRDSALSGVLNGRSLWKVSDQFIHGAKIARDQARGQMATPGRKIS
jgi:hypothetical protein